MTDERRRTACFYLVFPTRAPQARRAAIAELCTRANWRIFLGSLEMDFANGDVRWRCAIDVEDGALSETMVQNTIWAGIITLDEYHDALMKVMFAEADAASALAATIA